MHEKERHRLILSAVQEKPVVTVQEMVDLTESSEATIRRDIAALHVQKRLRRVRGGAEAISPPQFVGLAGRPFSVNETLHAAQKRAIAREAVELCKDGEPIIINGGTTTFQMVHFLTGRRMPIFTNSFPIAEHLLKHSKNTVMLSGGTIYREQNIILSPFDNDVTRNFYARRMFMGAQGLGPLGLMEADPLLIQAEQKLIDQADELVVLIDSSKFRLRSSLILCGLSRIATVITDEGIEDREAKMLETAGVALIVARKSAAAEGENLRCRHRRCSADGIREYNRSKGGNSMSILKKLMMTAALSVAMFATAANAEPVKIGLVVKSLGNGFFDAANKGAQEAAKELGDVEVIYTGPTSATAEGQIEIINSLVAQQVNAIAISANDPDALVPALKKAMDRGITVISWDSGVAPEGRQVHLNPSDTDLIGETIIKLAADYLPEGGDVAILSASSTATNQNAWIEAAKKVLPEKFPKINLVATVYGDDDSVKSTNEAKGLIVVLSEPQGDHRADHGRRRRGRAGRHRPEPDRQDQRHRSRAAVRVQEVHRQRRVAGRCAVEPDRSRLLGRADRAPARDQEGRGKAGRQDLHRPRRRDHARRHQLGCDGCALPVRQDQHRGILEDLLISSGSFSRWRGEGPDPPTLRDVAVGSGAL